MAKQANVTSRSSEIEPSAHAPTSDCATPASCPASIYGHKQAVIPITLPKKEVVGHLDHGERIFSP